MESKKNLENNNIVNPELMLEEFIRKQQTQAKSNTIRLNTPQLFLAWAWTESPRRPLACCTNQQQARLKALQKG